MKDFVIRSATRDDLPAIVDMLANDILGKYREKYTLPLPQSYVDAFEIIDACDVHELVVVEGEEGEIVGTMQLTFLQHLVYQGGLRGNIEQVRIKDKMTGKGLGTKMMNWAIDRAKKRGAHMLQLTSTKKREDAIKFYERLGFETSHEGMKYYFK